MRFAAEEGTETRVDRHRLMRLKMNRVSIARFPRLMLSLLLLLTVAPTFVSSPEVAFAAVTTANLNCVDFVDASTGYAAGAAGTIIKTTNGGVTWIVVRSGDTIDFRGISFINATQGYAVSLYGQVYYTADGGSSWEPGSADLAGELYAVERFYDTEFFAVRSGVAVGTAQDSPPLVFRDYPMGPNNWYLELSAGTYEPPAELPPYPKLGLGEFYGVEYTSATRGWAVGHDRYLGANKPVIWDYDSTRVGNDWLPQTVATGVGALYDASFASTTAGLAVGSGGKVYRTTNAGGTWTAGTVSPVTDLLGVEYAAVGGQGWAVGASGRIFRTPDGGATWAQLVSPTASYLEDIEYLGGSTAVAVGRSGAIVRTTNGTDWTIPTNPAAPQITSLTSASHPAGTWVSDTSVDLAWLANGEPVGYAAVLDQSPTTNPTVQTTTLNTATLNATGSGTWYAHVRAIDALGQWGNTAHLEIRVDVTNPVPSFSPEPTGYEGSASVPLSATDSHSGVASVSYSIDGGPVTTTASPTNVVVSTPGTYEVAYSAEDNAGNATPDQFADVTVIAVSPSAPVVNTLTSSSHAAGTWVSDTTVDLAWTATGTDIAGYAAVLDQSPTTVPSAVTTTLQSATLTASGSGTWYAHVRAIDSSDQWSITKHLEVRVDVTPPATTFSPNPAGYSGSASVPLSATDSHSGVATVSYSIDGGPVTTTTSPTNVVISTPGTYDVTYSGEDNVGNVTGEQTKSVVVNAVPVAPDSVAVEGATRYDTAIAAAELNFTEPMAAGPDGHRWVVVASGTNWPDALAASGLAGALQGPLLLTKPTVLSSAVKTYIQSLDADRIAIVGGTAAVSSGVANELSTLVGGIANVKRYGGTTRYTTANLIAGITVTASGRPAWDHVAFLATGGNFPDALAAGPLSAAEGRPLYLAHPTAGVSDATIAAMKSAEVQRVIVLGGPSVVSQASIDKIKAAGITIGAADRWYGSDRYDTARVVAENSLSAGLTASAAGLATGEDFPDALAGGVSQGLSGSVLVLTKSASLSPAASTFLNDNASEIGEVRFFGGLAALSSSVRTAAITAATP